MIKGLLVLCCAGVVGLVGCSGGSSAPVGDGSPSDDGKGASTANLPKKSDGTPAKADKPASGGGAPAPAGNPAGQPGQPGDPGGGGQDGQPGQNGRSSVNNSCCYNGSELACDAVQCFGGFDEEACESKCNQNDFDCLIGCVHKLGSAPPPTAQCKATGKKC